VRKKQYAEQVGGWKHAWKSETLGEEPVGEAVYAIEGDGSTGSVETN